MAGMQPSFTSGFMQGYNFVDRQFEQEAEKARQKKLYEENARRWDIQNERANRGMELRQEQLDTQKQQYKTQNERADQQLNLQQDKYKLEKQQYEHKAKTERIQNNLEAVNYAIEHDQPVDPTILNTLQQDLGRPITELSSQQYVDSVNTLSAMAQGQQVPDTQVLQAANYVYRPQIRKVVGKKGANGGTIIDSRITSVHAGKQPSTVAMDLAVTEKMPDGTQRTYQAPVTQGRDANPSDNVLQIPVQDVARNLAGQKALATFFAQPQAQGWVQQQQIVHGGEVKTKAPETRTIQRGNKKVTQEWDGRKWTDVSSGPQWEPEAGGGSGNLKASGENTIHGQAASLFGGVFDPRTGRISGLSKDQMQAVQSITARATRIYLDSSRSDNQLSRSEAVSAAAREMGIDVKDLSEQPQDGSGGEDGGAPYPDGTELEGPDGRRYIVRDGVPVPMGGQ